MTAASGILHKEYHEAEFSRRGGTFQMAQLWVNLPQAHKMDPPRYQGLTAAEMGQVTLPDGAGSVRVVAGQFQDARGPAKTFSPIELYHVELKAGRSIELPLPNSYNVAFLIMDGTVSLDADSVAQKHDLVVFKHDGDTLRVTAQSDAEWLVMSGEPIDEPVVQYGPFVMNTQQEIQEAFQDYNRGKFGHLV
jgi:redox-sensitive bicupin YhaK (pirin superfamily)